MTDEHFSGMQWVATQTLKRNLEWYKQKQTSQTTWGMYYVAHRMAWNGYAKILGRPMDDTSNADV